MGIRGGWDVNAYDLKGRDGTLDDRDQDPNEGPKTRLDAPRPPRVQDPPPETERKHPYVVGAGVVPRKDGGSIVAAGERKERRGFASMSPEKQREIASKGGRAAHQKGTSSSGSCGSAGPGSPVTDRSYSSRFSARNRCTASCRNVTDCDFGSILNATHCR